MRKAVRARAIVALAFGLLLLSAPAWAQSTGGSFGGGSFGGGSSGSSSSSSGSFGGGSSSGSYGSSGSSSSSYGSSGSSSSSYDSSSSGSYSGRSSCSTGEMVIGLVLVSMFIVPGIAALVRSSLPGRRAATGVTSQMHASQIQLGIDWRARRELQDHLARMAKSGDTATAAGRARLLGETCLALRRAEMSWLYVGYRDLGWHPDEEAEAAFREAASSARAGFRRELVRNADGQVVTDEAPAELAARADEGPGLIVVTVIAATRRELRGIDNPRDAASIRAAIEDRGALRTRDLVAFEVVWSPAAEQDRMSSAELEQHYPDLALIDPSSIAGRTFCSYCSGPFPMELLKCPHCGAPVEDKPVPPAA
jgi:uncharacterized membrane protein